MTPEQLQIAVHRQGVPLPSGPNELVRTMAPAPR